MPLLHRKTFVKKKVNSNIKPTDKVFYCELTGEVFTDYDEFWERLVLLNALVWTCELTGRPSLTYQEALECEFKARKCLSNVSTSLKIPLLYISTYTKRGKVADASDDIFSYIRDRYFVGEDVEAIVANHWYDCKVTKIVMPTKQEVLLYKQSLEDSDDEPDNENIVNGDHSDDDDDIIVIRDDHQKNSPKSSKKENGLQTPMTEAEYPPFPTVKYEVVEIEAWDYKEPKHHVVSWDQIRRSKSAFTREKCKLFVKQCMRLCPQGYWILKDSIMEKYQLRKMKYSEIFIGTPPKFEESKMKKLPFQPKFIDLKNDKKLNKTNKQREEKEKREEKDKKEDSKKKGRPIVSEEDKEAARKFQLQMKEAAKEQIRKKLEQTKIDRKWKKDLNREEVRLMKLYELDWWQKKEDLECEDHKDLPATVAFTSRIPPDYFGTFLMILDFVNTFADILELDDVYRNGITYQMLEQALLEKEVAGVFNDVVQLLLGAIFSLQEEEDEEVEGDSAVDMASVNFETHLGSKSQMAAVNIANKASTWSQQYQGVSLQKAPLDALTLTEVLRLHILASGATNVANAFWRHMNRGGYKHTDDPGLQFKLDEPKIISKLGTESLFDMTIEEKLKILDVLVSQILTYASVRDNVEEKLDKLKELSYNFKNYRCAASKKEKEQITAKKQKMKDLKVKMEKKLLEQRLLTSSEAANGGKAKIIAIEELEEEQDGEKETRSNVKKKEESEKQEKDFVDQIETLCNNVRHFQLGQDRAFRRYWLFNTIPGIFVEESDDHIGTCYEHPTPVCKIIYPQDNNELKEIIKLQAIRNVTIKNKEKETEKNSSDKENDGNHTPTKNGMKPLSEKNLLKVPNTNIVSHTSETISLNKTEKAYSSSTIPEEDEEEIVDLILLPERQSFKTENIQELHSKIFGLCSANDLTCPVHSLNHSRPKWSYFTSVEDVETLIQSLNIRGARECDLKGNLILKKNKIVNSLENFASFTFDYTGKEDELFDVKKSLKRNLNFPPGTPINRILELTLRDMILETEEKIDNGMLGVLKTPERDVWRQALVDGTSLSFNNPQELDWGGTRRINLFKSSLGLETTEVDVTDRDEFLSKDGLSQAGILKELSIAILQVGQALDKKYLKAPLAESEKLGRKRRKMEERLRKKSSNKKNKKEVEANENSSEEEEEEENQESKSSPVHVGNVDNTLRTPFERWEKSLVACTSFSQLFLHLATLDNSISWSRSAVVHKRCRICRRSSDPDNMLLCDECDGGYHMYCLKPMLKSIPDGDWFCDKCKPKAKPKSPKKQRKIYKEESEEEDDGEENEEDAEDEEEEEELEYVNLEYCYACEMGGELLLCDTCPKSFHMACADVKKVPRGDWSCPFCKEAKTSPSSSQKRKSTSSKSGSRRSKALKSEEIENALNRRHSKTPANQRSSETSEDSDQAKKGGKRDLDEVRKGDEYHGGTIQNMIHLLMSHNESGFFRKPVFKQELPDYYNKVKKPIDLRTIKNRFNKNKYMTDAEFIADVLLIFQNTQQYYKEGTPEYKAGLKVSKYFLNKVKTSDLHYAGNIDEFSDRPSKKKRQA